MKKFSGMIVLALILVLAMSSVALAAYQHQDDARVKVVYFDDLNGDYVKQSNEPYASWGTDRQGAAWTCETGSSTNCRNNFDEGDDPMGGSVTFTKLKANTSHVVANCYYSIEAGSCLGFIRSGSVTTGAPGSLTVINLPKAPTYNASGE